LASQVKREIVQSICEKHRFFQKEYHPHTTLLQFDYVLIFSSYFYAIGERCWEKRKMEKWEENKNVYKNRESQRMREVCELGSLR